MLSATSKPPLLSLFHPPLYPVFFFQSSSSPAFLTYLITQSSHLSLSLHRLLLSSSHNYAALFGSLSSAMPSKVVTIRIIWLFPWEKPRGLFLLIWLTIKLYKILDNILWMVTSWILFKFVTPICSHVRDGAIGEANVNYCIDHNITRTEYRSVSQCDYFY